MSWLALWFALLASGQEGMDDGSTALEQERTSPSTQVAGALVLKVGRPDEAAAALIGRCEELGGWFQVRDDARVSLRVPVGQVDELLAFASELGTVADRSAERTDLTLPLAEIDGSLASRRELLEGYYDVLKTAGLKSIVDVERQVVRAIEDIEELEGRRRLLRDRAAHARVEVSFQFRDRRAPRRDGSSSFAWLNSLNVADMVDGHRRSWVTWRTRGIDPVTPRGFSAWRKRGRYRAVSPDGVLYRARSVRRQARADGEFWQEALRERMTAAGYRVVSQDTLGVAPRIELASPLGQEDWTYVVAFRVDGRRIRVIEAAGEVSRFEARRTAIASAMEASL